MDDIRPTTPANLDRTLASFDDLWSPRILAQINDYDLRVAKVQGEYVWHRHPDTEELFLVLDGHLDLGIREDDGTEHSVPLGRGDVFVVPRARLHRPVSPEGATIVLVEPTGTLTTGDFAGKVPEHIDSTTGHRPAEPDGAAVTAVGTRGPSDGSRRTDDPALLDRLPDLGVDAHDIVAVVEQERAGR